MRARLILDAAADEFWSVRPKASLTALQKRWLGLGGSLTARLGALGRVEVSVTREAVAVPWHDERDALRLTSRGRAWVRDVVLTVDDVPCVAAHSVTPLGASVGVWQAIRRLRTRPLAELLYADPRVTRSALSSRSVNAWHPLYALATEQDPEPAPHAYLARRSVFLRHEAPLMVTECLLPALWHRLTRDR